MNTPLTTAEIVERLTTDSDLLDAWATWELGALPVPGPMNHADIATNLRTAASALLALEGEREAAEAELAKVREERDAFFDKLRQLLCINSVLTALKADAPLWLEHAEKLIDDHNAALSEKTV